MTLSQPTEPAPTRVLLLATFKFPTLIMYCMRMSFVFNQFSIVQVTDFFADNNLPRPVDRCVPYTVQTNATTNKYPTQSDTALSLTLSHGRTGNGTGTWW